MRSGMEVHTPFKWRLFEAEIIRLWARWYLHSSLSYWDLEVINMIRKGQVQGVNKGDTRSQAAFIAELFGVPI